MFQNHSSLIPASTVSLPACSGNKPVVAGLIDMQIKRRDTIESLLNDRHADSRLKPIEFAGHHKTTRLKLVRCICDCGNTVETTTTWLKNGSVKSCGCLWKQNIKKSWYGIEPHIPELIVRYRSMYNRCYTPSQTHYPRYGGRGVRMCDEWLSSYRNFLDWSLANGWKSGLQLDKDINGDGLLYSPDTCKWVTAKENIRNRRNTVRVVLDDKLVTIGEIADSLGVEYRKFWGVYTKYGLNEAIFYYKHGYNLKHKRAISFFRNRYNDALRNHNEIHE